MIATGQFVEALRKRGIDFFAGVPDSLLASFCAYVADHVPSERHVIAANEGGAVALAAGHYLATGRPGLVYLQNSGLGNTVNPLISLADSEVYSIPMVLLVGWRAEPGVRDEPQHVKQGRITLPLCETLEMPARILPAETEEAIDCLDAVLSIAIREKRPVALVVRAGLFEKYKSDTGAVLPYTLQREKAVEAVADALPDKAILVATTGHISRELYEYRVRRGQGHARDFLTVGSMGHASQIALGIALAETGRPVICLDGDGAVLMHMGGLALIGSSGLPHLHHIVLNNAAHDSVGGQPTVGFDADLVGVARACGYRRADRVEDAKALTGALSELFAAKGPTFLEVRVAKGARPDLGRPKTTPEQNKEAFMRYLQSGRNPQT